MRLSEGSRGSLERFLQNGGSNPPQTCDESVMDCLSIAPACAKGFADQSAGATPLEEQLPLECTLAFTIEGHLIFLTRQSVLTLSLPERRCYRHQKQEWSPKLTALNSPKGGRLPCSRFPHASARRSGARTNKWSGMSIRVTVWR